MLLSLCALLSRGPQAVAVVEGTEMGIALSPAMDREQNRNRSRSRSGSNTCLYYIIFYILYTESPFRDFSANVPHRNSPIKPLAYTHTETLIAVCLTLWFDWSESPRVPPRSGREKPCSAPQYPNPSHPSSNPSNKYPSSLDHITHRTPSRASSQTCSESR